jgi:phosphoribosylaminoimidazolecarboxamide formyltransferase/IMP cyclohydrolase
VPVKDVEHLTKAPELFGGRVKTLDPVVFGGLLFRRGVPGDERVALSRGIPRIDLVACNFHPFVEAVSNGTLATAEALDHIDVGGPSMVRAAAKNHPAVLPLVDPLDYPFVLEALSGPGGLSLEERRRLAVKAFRCTAAYDIAIADHLAAA